MKKLFVHIGAPKTGTSAIQHFMLRNRDALARQGVLYPQGGMLKSAHHLIGAAIHPLRSKRLGNATPDEVLAKAIAQIREEVAALKPRALVISTEYLWGVLSPAQIHRLLGCFEDYEIHIVAYLRRQDLMAQSLYVQAVKTGTPLSFSDWVEAALESGKGGFHFHRILTSWRDCGVPVSMDVRLYEKSQIGSDICSDFLKLVSAEPLHGMVSDTGLINTAPDMETTELLRLINSTLKDKDASAQLRRSIIKHSPPRALFAPLQYLAPAEVARFMQQFAEDNQAVAREFVQRADATLFYEKLPEPASYAPADFDQADLLRKLIELLPALTQSPAKPALQAPDAARSEAERARRLKKKQKKENRPAAAG